MLAFTCHKFEQCDLSNEPVAFMINLLSLWEVSWRRDLTCNSLVPEVHAIDCFEVCRFLFTDALVPESHAFISTSLRKVSTWSVNHLCLWEANSCHGDDCTKHDQSVMIACFWIQAVFIVSISGVPDYICMFRIFRFSKKGSGKIFLLEGGVHTRL